MLCRARLEQQPILVCGWCSVDQANCEFTVTAGAQGTNQAYTANVTSSSGTVLSRTSPVKVPATDPATAGGAGGSNDGIDIDTLAAQFGSAGAVCDSLTLYPGTHIVNTSTTDQWDACELVAQGASPDAAAAIRAALNTLAGVGIAGGSASLLAWLQHYAWINWGDNAPPHPWAPPPQPTSPPVSTPAPVASAADALATALMSRSAALAALGVTVARAVARECLFRTGAAGLSGSLCETLPIFVPGGDFPAATQHRIDALNPFTGGYPPWVRLTRRVGKPDSWYRTQSACAGNGGGIGCDEFPENKTYEGGNSRGIRHPPFD